jgi:hypothetical protein
VNNNWFKLGAESYSEHNSRDPDPATFRVLETMIIETHAQGMRWHFWAWGDETRKWTPVGAGGINGEADRRVQRYIAARLGPLPGWSMGYGFDLHEWVDAGQLNSWAAYLHRRFGWDHMLSARGHKLAGKGNINSYDGYGRGVALATSRGGPVGVEEVLEDLRGDPTRPHLYEERHTYLRRGFRLDMDGTRRLIWWQTMAGGMGGFFGFYRKSRHPYPKPEQLRCVRDFWRGRFLIDMMPAASLSDGLCLKTPDNRHYVFYREDCDSIQADLSGMPAPGDALAVDTRKEYAEIRLGRLAPGSHRWNAPVRSDWAVCVTVPAQPP